MRWLGMRSRALRFFTVMAVFLFFLMVALGWTVVSNFQHLGNLWRVVYYIRHYYLYPVNTSLLVDGAIRGMVESLDDPYSVYLDAKTYNQLKEQIRGSFGGLGILVGIRNEQLTVVRTYEGTPAKKAGLQPGDVIARIDGRETKGLDLETAVSLMRGPVGTAVVLTISRPGVAQPLEISLVREEINVPTVESRLLENGQVGYLVISQFTERTPEEVQQNLQKLLRQGIKGLVVDLRDNPGGELRSAVRVAENFVPAGPVVYISYRDGREEVHRANGPHLQLPLVVLINHNSASAAEILAGAIKDTRSGTLIGERTFGKGVVQTVFDLDNGAGLKLTTARYLTPSRQDINKKGIEPDVTVSSPPREINGQGGDPQLQKALEVLRDKLGWKKAA